MNIEASIFGKKNNYELELEKHQEPIDPTNNILLKLKDLDKKITELKEETAKLKLANSTNKGCLNEEEKIKLIKEIKNDLNINERIKEVLKDENIKDILFKEFEEKMNKIYVKKEKTEEKNELISEKVEESINKIINDKLTNKVDEKVFNENMNKLKEDIETKIKEINEIKQNFVNKDYLKKEIDEYDIKNNQNLKENKIIKELSERVNILNDKNKDNYIILKVLINKNEIGKDITIINQCRTYKLYKNFELDDIEVTINGEKSSLKLSEKKDFFYDSNNTDTLKKVCEGLTKNYEFLYNFSKEGTYTIKITFKNKLTSCQNLFYDCRNIIEIDISNFDCSQVLSCNSMFRECSNLKKINLGKLDFSLVTDFTSMFESCTNLIDLDVSNFNTKNATCFLDMFYNLKNLEKINVSNFNTSKCKTMYEMFDGCKKLTEIDMINWDMSNLDNSSGNPIDYLFHECENLKKIKISGNLKREVAEYQFSGTTFKGLPEKGILILNDKLKCNIPLNKCLPENWAKSYE